MGSIPHIYLTRTLRSSVIPSGHYQRASFSHCAAPSILPHTREVCTTTDPYDELVSNEALQKRATPKHQLSASGRQQRVVTGRPSDDIDLRPGNSAEQPLLRDNPSSTRPSSSQPTPFLKALQQTQSAWAPCTSFERYTNIKTHPCTGVAVLR